MNRSEAVAQAIRRGVSKSPPGARIPTIRAIAVDLNASTQTVQRALRLLCDRGQIFNDLERRCYRVGPSSDAPAADGLRSHPPVSRPEEVATRVVDMIVQGELMPGDVLPEVKELARRHHCSFGTVRAALSRAARTGYVHRVGRHYSVTRTKRSRDSRSSCFLVGRDRLLDRFGSHGSLLLRSLQTALDTYEAGPLLLRFSLAPETFAEELAEHRCAGFILPRVQPDGKWVEFLHARRRVPIVTIDIGEARPLEHSARAAPWFHLRADNTAAGATIGRHLYSLGRRRVALFSYRPAAEPWIAARTAGIRSVFDPDGWNAGAVSFHAPRLRPSLARIDRSSTQASGFIAGLNGILSRSYRHRHACRRSIEAWAAYSRARLRMAPLFDRALEDSGISAWVFLNDEWALVGLDHLRMRGIDVPGQISVASFDNSLESYAAQLTSYDFRLDAFGSAAVRCLLEPGKAGTDRNGVLVIPGRLVERRSTAEARR